VIGLPTNLFYGTGIPTAILLFHRGKKTKDVLFVDASRDFAPGTNQNKLRSTDIETIVKAVRSFKTIDKYAYRAKCDEIRENDFNLNISRYVNTFEPEANLDIGAIQRDIDRIELELVATRREMAKHLKELSL